MSDDTTPNLGLPYILAGQAQKHITHNESLRALDAIVQLAVIGNTTAAPPASPANGDRYIVPSGASGEWTGKTTSVAAFQDGAWEYYAPQPGWIAWLASTQASLAYDGTQWGPLASVNPVPLVGVNTVADAANRLAVKSDGVLYSHDDVTPGSGDVRATINKATAARTGAFLFHTGWSGRAEIGLVGDDNLHFKVSPDGATWREALTIERTTGTPRIPSFASAARPSATNAGAGALIFVPDASGGPQVQVSNGTTWAALGAGSLTQAATPTFSPVAGAYGPPQSVTIASATAGASIYYTTNGSDPTTSSTLYTGPVTVAATAALKALAVNSGFLDSNIATAAFTINGAVATPTFSPAAGSYGSAQSVTISCATAGATIYYTTNGTTPTTGSTLYTGAISVSASTTLRAIAVKAAFSDSSIATAAYTITNPMDQYTLPGGIVPALVLDFVNDVYYSAGTAVSLSALMSGTLSRDSSGLTLNQTNITAIGDLLTAFKTNGATCVAELVGPAQASYQGIVSFDNFDAPLFKNNNGIVWNYRPTSTLATENKTLWDSNVVRVVGTWSTTSRKIRANVTKQATSGTGPAVPTAVQIGSYQSAQNSGAKLRRLVVFASILSDANTRVCARALPWNQAHAGDNGVDFGSGQSLSLGSVLNYEYTQAWTGVAWINNYASGGERVIFSNTNGTVGPYTGYEIYIDNASGGKPCVRIMSQAFGGANTYIDVLGSTVMHDNKWHCVVATYDGSGLASGVKIYVDGVLETLTVRSNTLGAGSITGARTNPFLIGNQNNFETNYYLRGVMGKLWLFNEAKDATWVSTYASSPFTMPTGSDASKQLELLFSEGTGTTVADTSGNGRNGTLTASSMWM